MNITILRDGTNYGPYTLNQVKEYLGNGALSETDLAWHESLSDWLPLKDVILHAAAPPPLPVANQHIEAAPERKQSSKRKIIIGLAVGLGVVVIGTIALVALGSSEQVSHPFASIPTTLASTTQAKVIGIYMHTIGDRVEGRITLYDDNSFVYAAPNIPDSRGSYVINGGDINFKCDTFTFGASQITDTNITTIGGKIFYKDQTSPSTTPTPSPIETKTPTTSNVKPRYNSLVGTYIGTISEDKIQSIVLASMISGDRTVTLQLFADNTYEMQYAPDNITFSGNSMLYHQDMIVLQDTSSVSPNNYTALLVTEDTPPNLSLIGADRNTLAILKRVQARQFSPSSSSDSAKSNNDSVSIDNNVEDSPTNTPTQAPPVTPVESSLSNNTSSSLSSGSGTVANQDTGHQLVSQNTRLVGVYRQPLNKKVFIALFDDNTYTCDNPDDANKKVYGTYAVHQDVGHIEFNNVLGNKLGTGIGDFKGFVLNDGHDLYVKDADNDPTVSASTAKPDSNIPSDNSASGNDNSIVGTYNAHDRLGHSSKLIIKSDGTYVTVVPHLPSDQVSGTWEWDKLNGTIILHVKGARDVGLRINTDGSLNLNGANLPKAN